MAYRNHTMADGEFEYFIFEKNLQGDIVAVYDEYGFAAVTYTYDAWGNVTETLYDTTSNGPEQAFDYLNNGRNTDEQKNKINYNLYNHYLRNFSCFVGYGFIFHISQHQ